VRFRHQRSCGRSSKAEGQISPLANISPLAKLHHKDFAISEVTSELQEVKWIRATWSHLIGAEADFQHFADSEIFGYQRNFAEVAHINIFLFSFQPFHYIFYYIFLVFRERLGHF